MSGPDLLERIRMALAEAGHGDARVFLDDRNNLTVTRFSPEQTSVVPVADVWRAFSVAGFSTICRECFNALRSAHDCLADRPLVRDCGVAR